MIERRAGGATRRLVHEALDKLGWPAAEWAQRAKGDVPKIRIAQRLRAETSVTLKWIAAERHMGTWTPMANRLQQAKRTPTPTDQDELRLL